MLSKSYQVLWLPMPGLLFREPETATGIAHRIECQVLPLPPAGDDEADEPDPPPEVTGYRASLSPAPQVAVLDITADAGGVSVAADNLAGLFGIEFIDYLRNGGIARITRWDDLPASAEEIIEFRPSRLRSRTYQLLIAAELSDGSEELASYTIIIDQNWTAGRDRLKEEMNARSNQTG